jgi:hypothetical protein
MILLGGSTRARHMNSVINNVSGNCGGVKKQGVPSISINYTGVVKSIACRRAGCSLKQVCMISTTRGFKLSRPARM